MDHFLRPFLKIRIIIAQCDVNEKKITVKLMERTKKTVNLRIKSQPTNQYHWTKIVENIWNFKCAEHRYNQTQTYQINLNYFSNTNLSGSKIIIFNFYNFCL